jgi:hypothetical protein
MLCWLCNSMLLLFVCSSIKSSLGLIFTRNYRFNPLLRNEPHIFSSPCVCWDSCLISTYSLIVVLCCSKSPLYDYIPVFKTLCLLSFPLLLCSCVIVPRTTEIYNSDCKFIAKQSELKPVYVAALGGCKDEQCAGLLVFAGAVTAASAVISGSIVVIENIVYWLEKQKQCDDKISK